MKKIFNLSVVFTYLIALETNAQYPGAYPTDIGRGYFDGAVFARYDSVPKPPYYGQYATYYDFSSPILGTLGTNPFALTFGNPGNITSANYNYTATGNWITVTNIYNGVAGMVAINGQSLPNKAAQQLGLLWNGIYDGVGPTGTSATAQTSYPLPAGCSMTYTFDNNLEPLDQFIIADVDFGEEVMIEFLNASGNALDKETNMRIVHLTNDAAGATAPITSVNASTYGIDIGAVRGYSAGVDGEAYSFVVTGNNVRTVKITQVGYSNRASGGWWAIPVKGAPDRGDAPASYGDARILPLANDLKLGTLGGDTEAIPHHSAEATGDNMIANGIDYSGASQPQPDYGRQADEDGVALITPITNDGTPDQTITNYSVTATVSSKDAAYAIAWIDWDGNGIFDAGEALTASIPAGSTDAGLTFTWPTAILNGADGRTGTFMRILVSSELMSGASQSILYTGFGEVEDYPIPFAVPLAVELMSFGAYIKSNTVQLQWATASEQNNKGFDIEKSIDGKNWTTIGFVGSLSGNSNSTIKLDYTFTDNNLVNGQSFYRLKQSDAHGKYEYSPVRMVSFNSAQNAITVYPNPFKNDFSMSGLTGDETIKVYNMSGRMIKSIKSENTTISVSINGYSEGLYYITITTATGNIISKKIVKTQ